jgi:hypothetical protein
MADFRTQRKREGALDALLEVTLLPEYRQIVLKFLRADGIQARKATDRDENS